MVKIQWEKISCRFRGGKQIFKCNSLFSEAGQAVTKLRNLWLSPDRVNQLLFLNSYLKEKDGPDKDNTMIRKLLIIIYFS